MDRVNETARRERVAVTAVFFVNGALFSSLFARLPAIKADLGLGDGALGAILLLGAVGLLAARLVAGGAIERAGAPRAMRASAPAYAAAVALAALAPAPLWLALAFLAVGAANGVLDVAMNAEGAAVERRLGRPAMSSFHAAFSFGALAGAGLGALAAAAGLTPVANLAPVAVGGFALVGIGLATVFPLVVSAAARRPDVAPGPAIAAVASAGYAGFLVGPPAIGLVAELVELRAALLLPALLCAGALALAGALAASPGRPARQQ